MAFSPSRADQPWGKVVRSTWMDSKGFLKLSAPKPSGRYLWFYLLTGPDINIIPGLLTRMGIGTLADRLGWTYNTTLRYWKEIERVGMAEADWPAQVIWMPSGIIDNPPQNQFQVQAWTKVPLPDCPLVLRALQTIRARLAMKSKEVFLQTFDAGFSKRFPGIAGPIVPDLRHDDDESGRLPGLGEGDEPVDGPPDGPSDGDAEIEALVADSLALSLDVGPRDEPPHKELDKELELKQEKKNVIYCDADASPCAQTVENSTATKAATTWRRALGIAHQVIREWPENSENWPHETKERLQVQHMDPRQRSPRGGYLFQDAVEYALQQRREQGDRPSRRPAAGRAR